MVFGRVPVDETGAPPCPCIRFLPLPKGWFGLYWVMELVLSEAWGKVAFSALLEWARR